jgi:hypothetical protein
MRLTRQPLPAATLTAAQLGVPVAAATIGSQSGVLRPGEPAALLLGALVTIGVAVLAAGLAVRAGLVAPSAAPGQASLEDGAASPTDHGSGAAAGGAAEG